MIVKMFLLKVSKLFSLKSLYCSQLLKNPFKNYSKISSDTFISLQNNEKLGIVSIILQRPPVNSLNTEFIQQITSTIKDLEQKGIKGFILTSKFPRVFCAGLDIMEMYKAKPEGLEKLWRSFQEMWKTLYTTPLITMAAINGHCPAGGCLLALSCDYRIMVESNSSIGITATTLGLTTPPWLKDLYVNTIGFRNAEKALSLGTLFNSQEALSLNMVDELASNQEEMYSKIQQQMTTWLNIPNLARIKTKTSLLRESLIPKLESYWEEDVKKTVEYVLSDDVQNGLKMYMAKLKASKSQ